MPPQTIDYTAEAKLVATTQGQGGSDALAGLPIPIKVTGPWSNPSYAIDWASVFKGMSPDQLRNLPGNLGNVAKGLGASLPTAGAVPGLPAGITKAIPGLPQTPAQSAPTIAPAAGPQEKSPGLPLDLPKSLLGK
jgi:hypothetical protein